MIGELKPLTLDKIYNEPHSENLTDQRDAFEPAKRGKNSHCCKQNGYTLVLVLTGIFLIIGFCLLTWHYFRYDDTCRNPVHIVNSILNKEDIINSEMDPCDDFYSYACGRWNLSFPKTYNYTSVIEEVEVRNILRLEYFLKCSSFKATNSWSWFLKKTFDLCESEKEAPIESSRTVAFVKSLAAPLLDDKTNLSSLDDVLQHVNHKLLQNGLFSWDITLDMKDRKIVQAIRITPPKKPWSSDVTFSSRYHLIEYIREVLLLLGAEEMSIRSKCTNIAEVMLIMKYHLSELSTRGTSSRSRARMTFDHFVEEYDFIDFRRYFGEVSLSNSTVAVEEGEYFMWLRKYLEYSKRKNDRAIHDFLIWSSIDFFVPYMAGEFLKTRNKYVLKLSSKTREIIDNTHVCVNIIRKGVNFAASSFFMDKTLDDDSRAKIDDIVVNVESSFRDFLSSLKSSNAEDTGNWLHEVTRVFDTVEIGVPAKLRKIYAEEAPLPVNDDSFPSYYLTALGFIKTKMLNNLHEVPLSFLFLPDLLQPNGIFISLPLLLINMGIITPPFFDPQQPLSVNYAGLGFVIAHELAHSIDYLVRDVFSLDSDLKSKLQCLQEQYTSDKHLVDVKQEDFADNVAITVAYNAFLRHITSFSSLKNTTHEQRMFFLHYGQILCEDGSSFSTNYSAHHSPYKYRVNMPLSNSPVFSEIFGCANSSAMRSNNRCFN